MLTARQTDAAERQLENAEMLCLIRLGKGLEMMNSLDKPDEEDMPPPPPVPAAVDYGSYGGGYDDDDDGPVADDV